MAALLQAAACLAGTPRFARLGLVEGPVEVQLDAASSWQDGTANLPLTESTRIRTGPAARIEIELDDASVFRMAGEGLAELSDYARLSGGQRITVISLDRGLAYFTGEPDDGNSIHLLVPGAQAAVRQGSRIRLQAMEDSSEVAVIEGGIRFTMPSTQMDLRQGQSARVTVPSSSHFSLSREISPMEMDAWSEELDKAEADAPASRLDLDRAGKWISDGDYGTVWQPAPEAGWAPFRQGRWIWFQSVGFTWVGSEPWGWKPYHQGRWLQHRNLGWVWVPGPSDAEFRPGEVFWARSNNLALWGPLAPGESWNGSGPPGQFAALNATCGRFVSGVREIVPSPPADLPKDLLKSFVFAAALPSPPLPVSRLDASREPLRSRTFSAVEIEPDVRPVTKAVPVAEGDAVVAEVPAPSSPAAAAVPAEPGVPDTPPAPLVPGIIAITRPIHRSESTSARSTAPAISEPVSRKGFWLNAAGEANSQPLCQRWFQGFTEARLNYQPLSSAAGIRELKAGRLDFAASDTPPADAKLLFFPVAISAVVPIFNVPGIYDGLKLTPELLAGIYLGEIRYWNDRRIVEVNPRATLPPVEIVLVQHSEASAGTYTFTDYLSKISSRWKEKHGSSETVNWPRTGASATGDEGIANLVQQTPYSLGYVDYAFAMKNGLPVAAVRNRAGQFTVAQTFSLTAAAASIAGEMPADLRASITDRPDSEAYPIAAFTYLLVPQRISDQRKRTVISDLLSWVLSDGQKEAADLWFAPLPRPLVGLERRQIARMIKGQ